MSTLSTVSDPAAAVIVTAILGFVAHRLGRLKFGKEAIVVAQDVEKDFPASKKAWDDLQPAIDAAVQKKFDLLLTQLAAGK